MFSSYNLYIPTALVSVLFCSSIPTSFFILYIKVGNKVFRQEVGILMGTDCAPLLANLFLFYYEYKYMKNLVKDNLQAAMKFNGTMRYIDDLLRYLSS